MIVIYTTGFEGVKFTPLILLFRAAQAYWRITTSSDDYETNQVGPTMP